METLTKDQLEQRYGKLATSNFGDKKEEGVFSAIKQDIKERGAKASDILDESGGGFLGDVARGTEAAATVGGAVPAAAGQLLSKIPVVGPALQGIAGFAKKGFDAAVEGLSNTKLIKEAAPYTEGGNLENALRVGSGLGGVAGDVLAADLGVGATKSAAKAGAESIDAAGNIVKQGMQSVDRGTKYIKSGIRDIMPTRQNLIDESTAKALNLTPGDLANIKAGTGNEVGTWLADNNLIGLNKKGTANLITDFKNTNYKEVRHVIDSIPNKYAPETVPYFKEVLSKIGDEAKGVTGLEDVSKQVMNLLKKDEIELKDVQAAKELLDEHYSLYKVTGDVQGGMAKRGLANARTEMKSFIEQEVQKATGQDIRAMNNSVATGRSLLDAIEKRSPRGITRMHFTARDVFIGLGLTYFGSPYLGIAFVAAAKLMESPTIRLRFARYLDQFSDAEKRKISEQFRDDTLSPEVKNVLDVQSSLGSE